jgi:glycosyltransferase involved in cell wall biosynthesis
MPQVSVIIPSYNHETFVEECIESVLQQTFQDFEIIITDDASADETVSRIQKFNDPRISLFRHTENKGACVAANNCLAHSKGKYIAMLSSDDIWMPEKLEVQVDYLNSHTNIAAVFGKVIWIDEDSEPITDPNFPYYQVFNVNNRSRFEWLHHFFYYGNSLCHPCSLIRRVCYEEVGWLNSTMANLPDFDLWVRLCMKFDIHVLDQNLIKFRRLVNELNASGDTSINRIRTRFEYFRILDHYLKIKDIGDFYEVFPVPKRPAEYKNQDIPFLLAKLALSTDLEVKQLWGLNLIYNQLQNKIKAARLAKVFNYSHIDFIREVPLYDIFKIAESYGERSAHQMILDEKDSAQNPNEAFEKQLSTDDNNIENTQISKPIALECVNTKTETKDILSMVNWKIRYLKRRLSLTKHIKLIEGTGFFDTTWYLERYPDVKQSKMEPVKHYLLYGGFEGRDPSEKFSSSWYLASNEDVRKSGVNPLVHFLKFGAAEKRTSKKTV